MEDLGEGRLGGVEAVQFDVVGLRPGQQGPQVVGEVGGAYLDALLVTLVGDGDLAGELLGGWWRTAVEDEADACVAGGEDLVEGAGDHDVGH